jgi:hypothetical protein
VSSRVKKRQNKLARKVVSGKISVAEARARYVREMAGGPTRKQLVDQALRGAPAVVKSAGPAAVKVNAQHQELFDNPVAMRSWYARQVLMTAEAESLNPQIRERAGAARVRRAGLCSPGGRWTGSAMSRTGS